MYVCISCVKAYFRLYALSFKLYCIKYKVLCRYSLKSINLRTSKKARGQFLICTLGDLFRSYKKLNYLVNRRPTLQIFIDNDA